MAPLTMKVLLYLFAFAFLPTARSQTLATNATNATLREDSGPTAVPTGTAETGSDASLQQWTMLAQPQRLMYFPNRNPPTFPADANATRVVSAFLSALVYDLQPNLDSTAAAAAAGVEVSVTRSNGSSIETSSTWSWANTTAVEANSSIPFWESTALFHAVLSGDGTHLVGGRSRTGFDFQPFTNQVEVHTFNGTAWTEKYVSPAFFDERITIGGDILRDVIIGFTNGNSVATSYDGTVLAFQVHVFRWTGSDWEYANQGGVRVHKWNGTDYVQLGDTLLVRDDAASSNPGESALVDNDGIGNFQMDSTGTFIFLSPFFFQFENGQWVVTDVNLTTTSASGRFSPDFTRFANQKIDEDLVAIYQRDEASGKWNEIGVIVPPRTASPDGSSFGASFAWNHDGKTLVIGAPSEEEPREPDQVVTTGAVYVFEEHQCVTTATDIPLCTFALVGKLPCLGEKCGKIVHLSAYGKRVLFSYQEREPDDDTYTYFASYVKEGDLVPYDATAERGETENEGTRKLGATRNEARDEEAGGSESGSADFTRVVPSLFQAAAMFIVAVSAF